MSIPDQAAAFAENTARDDSHGYSQADRWGPDYDCSALPISAYKAAGVPLTCTYTGNMRADMLRNGFKAVPLSGGLKRGDVLLNDTAPHEQQHAAIYLGGGAIVQASGDRDGKPGDSSGKEIYVRAYYDHPWSVVLRYEGEESSTPPAGSFPPLLQRGMEGGAVLAMQTLLVYKWRIELPRWGCDADFGEETEEAVKSFQRGVELEEDGICGEKTWKALIGGAN